jgi:hypothetical protein
VTGTSPCRCSQAGADPFWFMAGTLMAMLWPDIMARPLTVGWERRIWPAAYL